MKILTTKQRKGFVIYDKDSKDVEICEFWNYQNEDMTGELSNMNFFRLKEDLLIGICVLETFPSIIWK